MGMIDIFQLCYVQLSISDFVDKHSICNLFKEHVSKMLIVQCDEIRGPNQLGGGSSISRSVKEKVLGNFYFGIWLHNPFTRFDFSYTYVLV